MVKTCRAVIPANRPMNNGLIMGFAAGRPAVVWRYTVRYSADLSDLRALKKYR